MTHSAARRFVLLACCILPLQAHASGRRPKNLLPDTLAVNAAVMALADSLDLEMFRWVWVAPDGACWLKLGTRWQSTIWRIGPDGRTTVSDMLLPGRIESADPIAALRNGDLLLHCTLGGHRNPRPEALARIAAYGHKVCWSETPGLSYADHAVLVDHHGNAHVFGREGDSGQAAYVRYSLSNDTVIELGRKLLFGRAGLTGEGRFGSAGLGDSVPWDTGRNTVMQWDQSGLVVGAATARSPESTMIFRFRVPQCEKLEHATFDAASVAWSRTLGVSYPGYGLAKSGNRYWVFVPSKDSITAEGKRGPCIYSCLLDSDLTPVRPSSVSDLVLLCHVLVL